MPALYAAQYLRMSTENQEYSLGNQARAISEYADRRGFTIIKTYTDESKSGLTLHRRQGLRQLLSDIVAGQHAFKAVLVYDVSRWGRFQDTDEPAHYEFLCRSAGVPVWYCAESFENDSSLASSVMKALKRSMAAEFSRELGSREFEAKQAIVKRGFHVGGRAPFGFRRKIVSDDPRRCRVLEKGERKYVRSERVILVHGPEQEVNCVRDIFSKLLVNRMTPREISRDFNSQGCRIRGKRWTKNAIEQVLTNPTYAGYGVWGRSSQRLASRRTAVAFDKWVLVPNSYLPIVSKDEFDLAQELLMPDPGRVFWTKARLLDATRALLKEKGELSFTLFRKAKVRIPCATTLKRIGFEEVCASAQHRLSERFLRSSRRIKDAFRCQREAANEIVACSSNRLTLLPARPMRLMLDGQSIVMLFVCRALGKSDDVMRWRLNPRAHDDGHVSLVCLLDSTNSSIYRCVTFPTVTVVGKHTFGVEDPWINTGVVVEDLSQLCPALRKLVSLA